MGVLRPARRGRAPDGGDTGSSDASKGLLECVVGPKQRQLHGSRRQTEDVGDLLGGPALHVAEQEDLLLAGGEPMECVDDPAALLTTDGVFLGRSVAEQIGFTERLRRTTPPLPPSRALAATAGVDRNAREPGSGRHREVIGLPPAQQLEKYLLRNVLGLVAIGKEQTAQAPNARMMRTIELLVALPWAQYAFLVVHVALP